MRRGPAHPPPTPTNPPHPPPRPRLSPRFPGPGSGVAAPSARREAARAARGGRGAAGRGTPGARKRQSPSKKQEGKRGKERFKKPTPLGEERGSRDRKRARQNSVSTRPDACGSAAGKRKERRDGENNRGHKNNRPPTERENKRTAIESGALHTATA